MLEVCNGSSHRPLQGFPIPEQELEPLSALPERLTHNHAVADLRGLLKPDVAQSPQGELATRLLLHVEHWVAVHE